MPFMRSIRGPGAVGMRSGLHCFLPLSYIQFAREESRLFELLFVRDLDLDMTRAEDFYREIGNEKKAESFGAQIGVEREGQKLSFSTCSSIPTGLRF